MNLNLTNKVFVVSGGGAGIGEAITIAAAKEGAKVVILGRTEIANTPIEHKLKSIEASFLFIKTELSESIHCKKAIEKIITHFGQIDVLVNNAGVNDGVGLENGSPERFVESLHKNLTHYFYLAHYALPYLKVTKGNIVNIGSKTSVTGQGSTSGYAASKGAQNALTREWAVELLPYGIRVNAVIPAEVYTPLYDRWIQTFPNPKEKLADITAKIPLGKRFTTAEEIANTVVFLASEVSAHTTGQILFVDGGYTHLDRAITG